MISRQFQLFFFITQPNNHAQADGFTMWPFWLPRMLGKIVSHETQPKMPLVQEMYSK